MHARIITAMQLHKRNPQTWLMLLAVLWAPLVASATAQKTASRDFLTQQGSSEVGIPLQAAPCLGSGELEQKNVSGQCVAASNPVSTGQQMQQKAGDALNAAQGGNMGPAGELLGEDVGASAASAVIGVGAGKAVNTVKAASAASAAAKAEKAAAEVVKVENNMRVDDAQQYINSKAPIEVPEAVIRKDNNFSATVNEKGATKAYINDQGDLVSANPQGTGDIKSQVRGGNSKDSPLISTTDPTIATNPKSYGDTQVQIDTRQVQRDLNSGNLPQGTTEVIPPVEVKAALQDRLDAAQSKFDANPSKKNTEKLDRATQDLQNAINDGECLIKGCVPAPYVSPPKPVNSPPSPLPSTTVVPVLVPTQQQEQ